MWTPDGGAIFFYISNWKISRQYENIMLSNIRTKVLYHSHSLKELKSPWRDVTFQCNAKGTSQKFLSFHYDIISLAFVLTINCFCFLSFHPIVKSNQWVKLIVPMRTSRDPITKRKCKWNASGLHNKIPTCNIKPREIYNHKDQLDPKRGFTSCIQHNHTLTQSSSFSWGGNNCSILIN